MRPQTRHSYSQVTAVTGDPVYLLTAVSACQTQAGASGSTPAACVDDDDESRTIIAYETDNLLVSSVTRRAGGTAALSATSAFTYDALGNLLTVDGPLSRQRRHDSLPLQRRPARNRHDRPGSGRRRQPEAPGAAHHLYGAPACRPGWRPAR